MFFSTKIKALFKCDSCETILVTELEDPKDIKDLKEDKMLLKCPCGGICLPLRD